MINGLEGIPGSGKSYEAVVYHVLAALQSGRKVITNLPLNIEMFGAIDPAFVPLLDVRFRSRPVLGTWDANRVDDKGNGNAFELWPSGKPPELPVLTLQAGSSPYGAVAPRARPRVDSVVFGQVWDFYDTWRHADGRGPLFVIDECHVAFPERSVNESTDPQVVEWFKLHRHFNADVLLMTQSFRDINQPIARLLAMLIKVRKADILGNKAAYIRKVHAGYRGAVISTDERKYLPQYFPLYKSHTQGLSVAESSAQDVTPFLVKFNRFKWFWLVLTAVYGVYAFWPKSEPEPVFHRQMQETISKLPRDSTGAVLPASVSSAPVSSASAPVPAASDPDVEPEPLREKMVHITGWMRGVSNTVYTFAVSSGGQRVFDLQESDLKSAGYVWKPLADCMGYLIYKGVMRSVTCDPPAIARGTDSAPVVIADGSRRSSAERPSSSFSVESVK